MLSKSAARGFFLAGTGLCSAAFIGLTIDSFNRIPALTHQDALTPSAIAGKHLWDQSNCMGCHTIMGEGAYYAPELTKVYERRGPTFIRAMLKDPEAMYPGQRKMQNYHFNDEQVGHLVDFLEWIGKVDLQGFPPKPTLMPVAVSAGGALAKSSDRPQMFNQICIACHALGGQGGNVGPALDRVGDKFDRAYIATWLGDPNAVRPGTKMPKLPLSLDQIQELAAFLSQQKTEVKP